MAYNALPSYNPGGAADFAPVQNAFSQMTAQNNANRNFGLAQQQLANQTRSTNAQVQAASDTHERNIATLTGGVAQAALGLDPASQQKIWEGIKSSHPDYAATLVAHGIDPNDATGGLTFLQNEARGYIAPEDIAYKKAQTSDLQSQAGTRALQTQLLKRQIDIGGQVMNGLMKPRAQAAPAADGVRTTNDGKRWGMDADGNYRELD